MNEFLRELEELVEKYKGEWGAGIRAGDTWEAMAGNVYGGRFFVSEWDAERASDFVAAARERYIAGNVACDAYFLARHLLEYLRGEHVPHHFLEATGLSRYGRPGGEAICEAARNLAAKRIGFSEFKRIVHENS